MTIHRPLSILLTPLVLCACNAILQAYSFIGLGDLPGGRNSSSAYGVSSNGAVVVGSVDSSFGHEAFRWTRSGGMVGLGDLGIGDLFPGNGFSFAAGVSVDGSVVTGTAHSPTGSEAFRWTQATGMVSLGDIPDGINFILGNAISGDGLVVVGEADANYTFYAFRWTSETGMVNMGFLDGVPPEDPTLDYSAATGVSGDGSVVVGQSNSGAGGQAFRWTTEDGLVPLGDLPGGRFGSRATAVSLDGQVVVGHGTSLSTRYLDEAFRWTSADGMVGLGKLSGSTTSIANGVSEDGSIIVGKSEVAFVWDSLYGMRNLQSVLANDFGLGSSLTGWSLVEATAVSADGRAIVGFGINPAGDGEGWLAIIPEPSTFTLIGFSLFGLFGLRKTNKMRMSIGRED
ncbi:PEP-CTERM sorting domain-containing protein [Bythopirellula goksoeyrii]|uniref:PEP-CTERM protein-sorting domain-containing protein n=1 Tax=Bythopirellula goksoeyrii TaxID=1400387 RepID=A0A5B9QCY6_9BACT|nr:PEP-CTERM sorting domain-containing protein [Bythopirellula goksoeyrii]QEG36818.1 hypothetical protein Pr1d_41540 [Bythopirellula goksoeyrii]